MKVHYRVVELAMKFPLFTWIRLSRASGPAFASALAIGAAALPTGAWAQVAARPFPAALSYPGCIKPAVMDQAAMNKAVLDYWIHYKTKYVKPSNGGTPGGGYYVEMRGTGAGEDDKTTSEAHGYGMIFSVLLAGPGGDPEAKQVFDGLYNMFDKHRSGTDDALMSWVIDEAETSHEGSATDGDMDIAYALLLAHYQWGSQGTVDYLAQAKRTMAGIKKSEMGGTSHRTMLGDWSEVETDTRPSDWMAGHMQAYFIATQDSFWLRAKDTVYSLGSQIAAAHSPQTGLMPDFVVGQPARPAAPGFLEAETDGDYSWNACRFPLRIAADYAHYGTPAARVSLNKIVTWIKSATGNNPNAIKAGYKLDGTALVSYADFSFTAPLVAAAMADTAHQDFLNKGWTRLSSVKGGNYYSESIALLSLLLMSGNWWVPDTRPVAALVPRRKRPRPGLGPMESWNVLGKAKPAM